MADYPFRSVLGLLLSAALTFSFSRPDNLWWPIVAAVAIFALAYCAYRNRAMLAEIYKKQEFDYSQISTLDRIVWRVKPRIGDMALGIVLLGLAMILDAYFQAIHPHSPSKGILKMIYDHIGNEGIVAFSCVLGVLAVLTGTEAIIGRRVSQRTPNAAVNTDAAR